MVQTLSLKDRVRRARDAKGLSQEDLAVRAGCTQATVAKIEAGLSKGSKFLPQIADALDVSVTWLSTGKGSERPDVPRAPEGMFSVPVISAAVAANWHIGAIHTLGRNALRQTFTGRRVGPDAFAMAITDESMEPMIPRGSIVIADPSLGSPRPGDYVIVTMEGDDSAICRRYLERNEEPALVPGNDQYPEITLSGRDVFTGVVRVIQPPEIILK